MTEWVAHAGGVGAIEHVSGGLDYFRSCLDRAPQQDCIVVEEDVEACCATPKPPWLPI